MLAHGMIEKKQFGIFTKTSNDTDRHSQIRFGGFNEALYAKKHTMQWIPTIGSDTWKIEIHEVAFHGDDILGQSTTALINPGFPYIAVPLDEFTLFT